MSVRWATRPLLLPAALVCLAVLATGCAKTSTKPTTPVLSQEEADDLAQQMAVSVASDGGGWLYLLQSTAVAVPQGTAPVPGPALASWHPGGESLQRDTTFTRATVDFDVTYLYTDTSATDSILVWDPSVIEVDFESRGHGTIENPNFNVLFGHEGSLEGVEFHTASDTIVFNGTTVDSVIGHMIPMLRTGNVYFETQLFTDLTDVVFEDDVTTNPWPSEGLVEFIVFADRLNGPPPSDINASFEVLGMLQFDGTQTPLLLVSPDFDDPAQPVYRYRLNLATGVIVRD